MFGRSQVNQHPFFTVNQLLVSTSGLRLVPEKGLLSPKWGVCHIRLQDHLFPGHGPKLHILCQVWEIETKVVLWWVFFSHLVNTSAKMIVCSSPYTLCRLTDKQEIWATWCPCQGFCSSTSVGPCYLLRALCIRQGVPWELKLPDSSKCWPDLLHSFLSAYEGVSFVPAYISCYSLWNIFFKKLGFQLVNLQWTKQVMFISDIHIEGPYLWLW